MRITSGTVMEMNKDRRHWISYVGSTLSAPQRGTRPAHRLGDILGKHSRVATSPGSAGCGECDCRAVVSLV